MARQHMPGDSQGQPDEFAFDNWNKAVTKQIVQSCVKPVFHFVTLHLQLEGSFIIRFQNSQCVYMHV